MNDKIARWKLRLERELIGGAHPFRVDEQLVVRTIAPELGAVVQTRRTGFVREFPEPYACPWGGWER